MVVEDEETGKSSAQHIHVIARNAPSTHTAAAGSGAGAGAGGLDPTASAYVAPSGRASNGELDEYGQPFEGAGTSARPMGSRPKLILTKTFRQAKGPDGTNGFPAGWRG